MGCASSISAETKDKKIVEVKKTPKENFLFEFKFAYSLFIIANTTANFTTNYDLGGKIYELTGSYGKDRIIEALIKMHVPSYWEGQKLGTKLPSVLNKIYWDTSAICKKEIIEQLTSFETHAINYNRVSFVMWIYLLQCTKRLCEIVDNVSIQQTKSPDKVTIIIVCKELLCPTEHFLENIKKAIPLVQGVYLLCVRRILDAAIPICQKDWQEHFSNLLAQFDDTNKIFTHLFEETQPGEFVLVPPYDKNMSQIILSYNGIFPSYEVVERRLLTRKEFAV